MPCHAVPRGTILCRVNLCYDRVLLKWLDFRKCMILVFQSSNKPSIGMRSSHIQFSRTMPCHDVPCLAMQCSGVPCHDVPCVPGHALPCHTVMPCGTLPCQTMLSQGKPSIGISSSHPMECTSRPHFGVGYYKIFLHVFSLIQL